MVFDIVLKYCREYHFYLLTWEEVSEVELFD